MTLSELLSYLGDAKRFPFFGGWVAPPANEASVACGDVKLAMWKATAIGSTAPPPADKALIAYYRKVSENFCDVDKAVLYVANYGTESEAAFLKNRQAPQLRKRILTLAGVASATGDPIPALAIYSALYAAANATPPNMLAMMFLPLLTPGTGVGIDFADPATLVGIDAITPAVLTIEHASLLKGLADMPATEFA